MCTDVGNWPPLILNTLPHLVDELPQTVTIKDNVPSAPDDTPVKGEPLDAQEKPSDGGTSSPQLPPSSITVKAELKAEVKKEEVKEEDKKENNEENDMEGPCTKMTMRLRRNLNNPQCVSRPKDAKKRVKSKVAHIIYRY